MEFNNPIVGEEELIRSAIKSQNYAPAPNGAGWRIAADGGAEFTNLLVNSAGAGGTVELSDGSIKVYRASDGELIAEMTPNGSGGFWTYNPDALRVPFGALTASRVQFGEVDTNYNQNTEMVSFADTGGHDPVTVEIASGNVGDTVNSASAYMGLAGSGDTSTTPGKMYVSMNDGTECQLYVNGPIFSGDAFGTNERIFQTGTQLVSFVALSTFTVAVNFPVAFANVPTVTVNINSGAGVTARWGARAFNVTTTGFTLFVFEGDAADPAQTWTNVPVQWQAMSTM